MDKKIRINMLSMADSVDGQGVGSAYLELMKLLKEDGKVDILGDFDKTIDVRNWENIEKVYTTTYAAYAIRKDGTITVAGKSMYESWEYQYVWEDIKKLEPAYNHIVGLKNDGTVVASGDNTQGQCEVGEWSYIVDSPSNVSCLKEYGSFTFSTSPFPFSSV